MFGLGTLLRHNLVVLLFFHERGVGGIQGPMWQKAGTTARHELGFVAMALRQRARCFGQNFHCKNPQDTPKYVQFIEDLYFNAYRTQCLLHWFDLFPTPNAPCHLAHCAGNIHIKVGPWCRAAPKAAR